MPLRIDLEIFLNRPQPTKWRIPKPFSLPTLLRGRMKWTHRRNNVDVLPKKFDTDNAHLASNAGGTPRAPSYHLVCF